MLSILFFFCVSSVILFIVHVVEFLFVHIGYFVHFYSCLSFSSCLIFVCVVGYFVHVGHFDHFCMHCQGLFRFCSLVILFISICFCSCQLFCSFFTHVAYFVHCPLR